MTVLSAALQTVARLQPLRVTGRVAALRGLIVLVADLPLPVGALVRVVPPGDDLAAGTGAPGEIVGFDGTHTIVMMLGATPGIRPGDRVVGEQATPTIGVGPALLGRVLDGLGRPIDDKGPVGETTPRLVEPEPIKALHRRRIKEPLHTGVRAIDLMTTLGRGQRMGIFAGPGVGKSTLLGTVVKNCAADVSVIALIGERGREVKDFVEHTLGEHGMRRAVVVVATGDESALMRIRAALVACTVAEFFRDQGKDVMLVMDSLTRLAHAQRQIGLSVGEPPATKGYTPSVFSLMARLLERAGSVERGSITGLYTVLVEGDEMTEPVSDAARGILDGHIILSRKLAQKAHYPAIDVLDSISRIADDVCDEGHTAARRQMVRILSAYRDVEDLVQIGAYARGSNAEADVAIAYQGKVNEILRQASKEVEPFDTARSRMVKLAVEAGAAYQQLATQQARQPQSQQANRRTA